MNRKVKRYDPINSDGTCGMCVEDADYGAYVEYADYAALEAENARLQSAFDELAERYGKLQTGEDSLLARVVTERDALRAELVAARKQEPVASVVSCYAPSGKRVALNTEYQDLPVGTQLYALPPASPDVEGLVKALEEVRSVIDAREMPSELALAALSNMIDTTLAASTGQEVES